MSNGIIPEERLNEGLPELEFKWLPEKMRDFAKTLSESQQVQPAMAIMACIATASACVVGKYRISAINSSWTDEWSSLYVLLVAPSGGRKSSVFSKAMKPIELWQRKRRTEMMPEYKEALGTLKIKKKELDNLQKLAEQGDTDAVAELNTGDAQRAVDIAERQIPILPDLIVNDATVEALEVKMAKHYNRLFSADAEGGALKNLTGARWKTPPSFGVFLKAYTGDLIVVDRITRSLEIPRASHDSSVDGTAIINE